MYVWLDQLQAVLTIIRMGRGLMMGVDHNRNMEWVGASAGLWVIELDSTIAPVVTEMPCGACRAAGRSKGSFDCVTASLRETVTPLRMTRVCSQPILFTMVVWSSWPLGRRR